MKFPMGNILVLYLLPDRQRLSYNEKGHSCSPMLEPAGRISDHYGLEYSDLLHGGGCRNK